MRKPKMSSVKLPKSMEEKYIGAEPKDIILDKIGTLYAYNHFNYFHNTEKAVEYFEAYLEKNNKTLVKKFKKYPLNYFPNNIGWISRMVSNGVSLPSETINYFKKFIEKLEAFEYVEKTDNPLTKVISYENSMILFLESEHDKLVKDSKYKFNADEYFKVNVPTLVDIKKINAYYGPILEELLSIPKDKAIAEGYSKYTKKEIQNLITFYSDILKNTQEIKNDRVRTKTPRKAKPVSVQKQLKKIRYLEKDNALNITSISPSKILTSSCIVLYNRERRKLYICESPTAFQVNGISIVNMDPTKSFSKTIRKPELVKEFLSGNKSSIVKKFEALTTVASPIEKLVTTEETLILRTFI